MNMPKNKSLLYRCNSLPSQKNIICQNTLFSPETKNYGYALKKAYTDEDLSSNSTCTTSCSLTAQNLEMHTKRLSLYGYSKYERIKSFVDSITPEVMRESDVYKIHEQELTYLLIYEQEKEPLDQHVCLKENKKKKGWFGRFKQWIKLRDGPKKRPWSWSASTLHEKDKMTLEMINVLNNATSRVSVDRQSGSEKINYWHSHHHPKIASVPIERQPKFSLDINKRKSHIRRTSKSCKQIEE